MRKIKLYQVCCWSRPDCFRAASYWTWAITSSFWKIPVTGSILVRSRFRRTNPILRDCLGCTFTASFRKRLFQQLKIKFYEYNFNFYHEKYLVIASLTENSPLLTKFTVLPGFLGHLAKFALCHWNPVAKEWSTPRLKLRQVSKNNF